MRCVRNFVIAGATVLLSYTAASAADLPPIQPIYQPPIEEFHGWYLRGDIGMTNQRVGSLFNALYNVPGQTVVNTGLGFDSSPLFGIGVGYQWNSWLRTDVTAEYRTSTKGKAIGSYTEFCPGGRCFDVYDFDHQASVFLVNAYVDLGTWWCLTPFIGAGVGGARHDISSIHDVGFIANGTTAFGLPDLGKDSNVTWDLAWAIHAGFGYNVSNNLKLEFAYRYLNMGSPDTAVVACNSFGCAGNGPRAFYTLNDLTSHDFKIGMRWLLNEPVPPPPPVYAPPLIRKG